MYKKSVILLGVLSLLLVSSCSDDDNPVFPEQVTGSGDLITEERTLSEFHSVDLLTVGVVRLTSAAEQSVSITVDDNVMQYIVTTVVNGELRISSDPSVSLTNFDLTVNLAMTDLESLTLSGVGTIISLSQFEVDSLDIVLSGVGNITMGLQADYLMTSLSGVGSLNLNGAVAYHDCLHGAVGSISSFPLISDTTIAILSGVGSAEVYVNDTLDVTISGSGSLYYKGQPVVVENISGTGQVIDAN